MAIDSASHQGSTLLTWALEEDGAHKPTVKKKCPAKLSELPQEHDVSRKLEGNDNTTMEDYDWVTHKKPRTSIILITSAVVA
ncbi:hypothetical protein ANCCEY_06693 [Ancylostoma ceylanicum]|uniref:Uncharacterized protein n=1 Tax=Ancylostoma ceylanicum TaxID=53326 RepID=A0A0D6LQM8_9BILA|nr:hypothetical protein ANCCEY_06693 [Ancylostoma ceylanicum]